MMKKPMPQMKSMDDLRSYAKKSADAIHSEAMEDAGEGQTANEQQPVGGEGMTVHHMPKKVIVMH